MTHDPRLTRINQAQHMRVLQIGDGLDLPQEPLGSDHCRQLRPENFDGDSAMVLEIFGQIDRGHTALTKLPLDAIAVGQGLL